jgi:NADH:ubiquinone oxidoreductase subunit H
MRFGFFFFAEYVNVFIVSALFSAVPQNPKTP